MTFPTKKSSKNIHAKRVQNAKWLSQIFQYSEQKFHEIILKGKV